MRYVALLRGINVGGSNKVDMRALKALFEEAGVADVRTYINSGNVIFSTAERDRRALVARLEGAIEERFGFRVDVTVRDAAQLRAVVDAMPDDWVNDETMKCDVLFLWDDVDRPSVLDEMLIKADIEDAIYVGGAVIRRVDRENVTRSGLMKLPGTPLYKRMTVRNCNTARKLVRLMEEG